MSGSVGWRCSRSLSCWSSFPDAFSCESLRQLVASDGPLAGRALRAMRVVNVVVGVRIAGRGNLVDAACLVRDVVRLQMVVRGALEGGHKLGGTSKRVRARHDVLELALTVELRARVLAVACHYRVLNQARRITWRAV